MRIRQLVIFSLFLFTIAACGKKGPVRPLASQTPAAATDVALRQQGESLLLSWQLPLTNRDGSPLDRPPLLDIFRISYEQSEECPSCLEPLSLLASIDPELPTPAQRTENGYQLIDSKVTPGRGYQYRLIPHDSYGGSGPPLVVRAICQQPVPAPQNLEVQIEGQNLLLRWSPLSVPAGEELLGYIVYRRQDGADSLRLNTEPVPEEHFMDQGPLGGQGYHYQVRGLVRRGAENIEGLAADIEARLPDPTDQGSASP